MKWAHASTCAQFILGCYGPTQAHPMWAFSWQPSPQLQIILACTVVLCSGLLCTWWANALIFWILECMKWAHASACVQFILGCCGPTWACQQGAAHSQCRPMQAFCLAAILLAPNYTGATGIVFLDSKWANLKLLVALLLGNSGPSAGCWQHQVAGQPHDISSTASHWFWAIRRSSVLCSSVSGGPIRHNCWHGAGLFWKP